MGKIIPRWEWRTFGEDLSEDYKSFSAEEPVALKESSEKYILSRNSDENCKVREGLMDIKSMVRQKDGLEQWTVLGKAEFPIHINDLALVYKAYGVNLPYLEKDEYTYDEYMRELIETNDNLKIVSVDKKRFIYNIDDAIVEFAEVKINGNDVQTIAVEHADIDLVKNVVDKLGLKNKENVNYINAMKKAVGL